MDVPRFSKNCSSNIGPDEKRGRMAAALVLENTMVSLRGASWVPTDALSTYCQRTARIRLDDGWRNVVEIGSEEWLEEELAEWRSFVREGLCTMDPHIGNWTRTHAGTNDVPHFIPIRLSDAVSVILSEPGRLLRQHHDAGGDALMHWLVFRELSRRAKASQDASMAS